MTKANMPPKLRDLIFNLECELQKPEVRKSVERLSDIISDDLQEIISSGDISSKANCLITIPAAPDLEFTMTDFSARQLSDDLVQTFFKTKKVVVATGQASNSRRSTIWRKEGDKWRMYYHQGTPTRS